MQKVTIPLHLSICVCISQLASYDINMELHKKIEIRVYLKWVKNPGQQRKPILNEEFFFANINTGVHHPFVIDKSHFYLVCPANKTKQIHFVVMVYNLVKNEKIAYSLSEKTWTV